MSKYLIAVAVPTYEDCLKKADACYTELNRKGFDLIGKGLTSVYTLKGTIEFFPKTWLDSQEHTTGKRYTKLFYASPNRPAFKGRVKEETSPYENFLDWVIRKEREKPFDSCSECSICIHKDVCKYKDEVKDESARLMEKVWAKNVTIKCKFFEEDGI